MTAASLASLGAQAAAVVTDVASRQWLAVVRLVHTSFDGFLASLREEDALYVLDVVAAFRGVASSLARFLASLWTLSLLVVVPSCRRGVALFRRQPLRLQLARQAVDVLELVDSPQVARGQPLRLSVSYYLLTTTYYYYLLLLTTTTTYYY